MKGLFHYENKTKLDNNDVEMLFSFLFKPTGHLSSEMLAEGIEKAGISSPFPDLIIIQCMEGEFEDIKTDCKGSNVLQALRRVSKSSGVYVASYSNSGVVKNLYKVDKQNDPIHTKSLKKHLSENHPDILKAGLAKIFSEQGVIQIAPSGFTFVKPSGDRSRIFLKAEEALLNSERVNFVAFALLPILANRKKTFVTPIDSIFVDTMGIASIAYALRDLYWKNNKDEQRLPRIESFHSHSGLKDFEPPLNGTSFCLISASQSMRLQDLWQEKTRASDDEVITLLTLNSAKKSDKALFSVKIENTHILFNEFNALNDIRIVGERFNPDQIKPRKVLLRQTVHQVHRMLELAKDWHEIDLFKIQVNTGNKCRPIYLNVTQLLEKKDSVLFGWIDRVCDQYVPLSLHAVIAQNDQQSQLLARVIIERLNKRYKISLPSEPINGDALSSAEIDKDRALLIVAAVIGKGTKLLSISRELRDLHVGARSYAIGFHIAENETQIQTLKQNLKSPASKSKWVVETFTSLALGKGLGQSFQAEANLKLKDHHDRNNKLLGSHNGLLDNTFIPSHNNDYMKLRKDFAYWPNINYTPSSRLAPWIFAMISALLQKAREDKTLPLESRLSSEAYQNVVLDPENFLRYNDGLIQAAILRAAHPHELDYSCSRELSEIVKNILLKIFEYHSKDQGEASLEFAIALRTQRLNIQNEHLNELKQYLKDKLDESQTANRIREILELDGNAEDPEKIL